MVYKVPSVCTLKQSCQSHTYDQLIPDTQTEKPVCHGEADKTKVWAWHKILDQHFTNKQYHHLSTSWQLSQVFTCLFFLNRKEREINSLGKICYIGYGTIGFQIQSIWWHMNAHLRRQQHQTAMTSLHYILYVSLTGIFNSNRTQKSNIMKHYCTLQSSFSTLPFAARMWRCPSEIKSPSFCLHSLLLSNLWLSGSKDHPVQSRDLLSKSFSASPAQVSKPAHRGRSIWLWLATVYMWAVPIYDYRRVFESNLWMD